MMDGSNRQEFADVEVLSVSTLIVMCRVGRKVVGISPRGMLPGTTLVAQAGAKGRRVLSHEMALNLGLL
jgi:hypothetical protein